MSSKFKRGQLVRQIMPAPIQGVVSKVVFDENEGTFHYHVAVRGADGGIHDRSMPESALQLVPLTEPAEPPVLTERITPGDVGTLEVT
jgi:hypothetical protein